MTERKSLAQMAAEANGGDPWACPRCGCRDWRVDATWMANIGLRRKRVCRHCGKEGMTTTEKPDRKDYRVVSDEHGEIEDAA